MQTLIAIGCAASSRKRHAAGILNHPNVVRVYAIGQQDGFGRSWLPAHRRKARRSSYTDQLVEGLAAAHDKGIVHRDLEPENVFITHEMLAGRRSFTGDTSTETMTAILKHDPPPIAGVPARVEQVVRHCLEKEPAARYQSVRDLAFQLRLLRRPA